MSGARVLAGLVLFAVLATGCGIRSTSVPVDAGAAPSRSDCVLPGARETAGRGSEGNTSVRIYLACGSRVSPVERRVQLPGGSAADGERLTVARELLSALRAAPDAGEESAGFSTKVPRELRIDGPDKDAGDPREALRLSMPLDELPSFAVAQIVCTYADTAASDSDDRSVLLGGPARGAGADAGRPDPLRRLECDTALRTR